MKTGQILRIGSLPVGAPIFVILAPISTSGEQHNYFLAKDDLQFTLSGLCLEVGDKYLAETVDGEFISLKDYGIIPGSPGGTRSFYDEESAKEYAKSLEKEPIPDWMNEFDFGDICLTLTRDLVDRYAEVYGHDVIEITIQ